MKHRDEERKYHSKAKEVISKFYKHTPSPELEEEIIKKIKRKKTLKIIHTVVFIVILFLIFLYFYSDLHLFFK